MSLQNAKRESGKGFKAVEIFDSLLSSIDERLGNSSDDFIVYRNNPIGFGEEVLGETYTDEVKTLMESVRDNLVTIAKSANATGKTHAAGRVAVWWYKSFPDSQVYTAAAPPEGNLRRLLWGEIRSIAEKHQQIFESNEVTKLHIQRSAQSFITGVTIPTSGTAEQREAKFSGMTCPQR